MIKYIYIRIEKGYIESRDLWLRYGARKYKIIDENEHLILLKINGRTQWHKYWNGDGEHQYFPPAYLIMEKDGDELKHSIWDRQYYKTQKKEITEKALKKFKELTEGMIEDERKKDGKND